MSKIKLQNDILSYDKTKKKNITIVPKGTEVELIREYGKAHDGLKMFLISHNKQNYIVKETLLTIKN